MNRTTEQRNTEVTKTIGMLDQMPRIEVNHLFRVRLMQRIEAMEVKKTSWSVVLGGSFNPRLAVIALLLVLNIASTLMLFMHKTPQATGASGTIAESLSEDYGGPALSYYDDQTTIDR